MNRGSERGSWNEGRYHRRDNLLQRLGHGIRDYSPSIALGALIGVGFGAVVYGSASLEQLVNPGLVDFIRSDFHLQYLLTSREAMAVVILDHPISTLEVTATLGALTGGLINSINRYPRF